MVERTNPQVAVITMEIIIDNENIFHSMSISKRRKKMYINIWFWIGVSSFVAKILFLKRYNPNIACFIVYVALENAMSLRSVNPLLAALFAH